MKKICFKCHQDKPLVDFYLHPGMADGHLNKCKDCSRNDARSRIENKKTDIKWVWEERKRSRAKAHKYRNNKVYKKSWVCMDIKKEASVKAYRIPCPKGFHRHHWSYNKDHMKDVVILSRSDHYKIHRYMDFDEDSSMYRTMDGELLDTKEKSLKYYNHVLSLEENEFPEPFNQL